MNERLHDGDVGAPKPENTARKPMLSAESVQHRNERNDDPDRNQRTIKWQRMRGKNEWIGVLGMWLTWYSNFVSERK